MNPAEGPSGVRAAEESGGKVSSPAAGAACSAGAASCSAGAAAAATVMAAAATATATAATAVPAASSSASLQASRIILTDEALDSAPVEDLRSHWRRQDIYVNSLETLNSTNEAQCSALRESEEKLKQQLGELALRERVLVRRLAAKEQDIQEYAAQLAEMKSSQVPTIGGLRSALVDPAVNILLQKLRQELAATRTKLDDTQNELAAWKFTPDSNTGKRLMAKCRLLYQENEELGRMVSNGRLAKLEGELALQKSFSEEVKKSQSELDELLQDLDEDVEGMQSTIYYLQQELRKAKEAVTNLEQENATLRNVESRPKSPSAAATTTTTTPPVVNGLADVVHHNGKWCKSDDTDNRTNNNINNNNNNNNEDGNKNEEPSGGGDVGGGGGRGGDDHRLSDDSVVVVNTKKPPHEQEEQARHHAKRTPSENGGGGGGGGAGGGGGGGDGDGEGGDGDGDEGDGLPPVKKLRPDDIVVVVANGDISAQ